jgi:hypothetical protein
VLEVAITERMVQGPAGALGILRRAADDVHDGYLLGIAARHRVGCGKLADAESRYQCRHSAKPPIPVGGVAGVELVGVADPADARMGDDVVEELQVVIARNAEDLRDAELGETVQQVVTDGVCGIGRGISHRHDGTLGRICSG